MSITNYEVVPDAGRSLYAERTRIVSSGPPVPPSTCDRLQASIQDAVQQLGARKVTVTNRVIRTPEGLWTEVVGHDGNHQFWEIQVAAAEQLGGDDEPVTFVILMDHDKFPTRWRPEPEPGEVEVLWRAGSAMGVLAVANPREFRTILAPQPTEIMVRRLSELESSLPGLVQPQQIHDAGAHVEMLQRHLADVLGSVLRGSVREMPRAPRSLRKPVRSDALHAITEHLTGEIRLGAPLRVPGTLVAALRGTGSPWAQILEEHSMDTFGALAEMALPATLIREARWGPVVVIGDPRIARPQVDATRALANRIGAPFRGVVLGVHPLVEMKVPAGYAGDRSVHVSMDDFFRLVYDRHAG